MNSKILRAFLGTGLLGSGFVEGLLASGETVRVWNRTRSKADPLTVKGATVYGRAEDAVRGAGLIHICVSDDAAVDALLDAIIPSLEPEAWVVDHTTTSPAGTRARYERARREGFRFAHAPVFMGPSMARERRGLMLLSATPAVEAALQPLLAPMTGELLLLGPREDQAAATKLFGNAMLITVAGGVSDILAMARASNVEPAAALSLFSKLDVSAGVKLRGARMAKGDFSASFELSMARKDLSLMLDAAGAETLAVLPALAARMDALIARGHGQDDLGVLAVDAIRPRGSTRGMNETEDACDRALERLFACHRRISEELVRLADALTPSSPRRDDDELRAEEALQDALAFAERTIARHDDDEERSIFPRAVVVPEARPLLERLSREHQAQRDLWDRLGHGTAVQGHGRQALASELSSSYAAHMRVEEDELFPLLAARLPREDWQKIDEEMTARRQRGGGNR